MNNQRFGGGAQQKAPASVTSTDGGRAEQTLTGSASNDTRKKEDLQG